MKLDIGVGAGGGAPNSIVARIASLRERIATAAIRAGRTAESITLVAVTKKQSRESVLAALAAGVQDIAENYVQEARPKYAGLPPARKHFIGHVQTNKAKAIVELFDVVQSIDRIDAGRAIAKAARDLDKPTRVLVQINISPSERFGIAPSEAGAFAARLRAEEGLAVDGVMAVGPDTADRGQIVRAFATAALTLGEVGGDTLSLGMSGDLEEAIDCGSTMLRIGTALFGGRA